MYSMRLELERMDEVASERIVKLSAHNHETTISGKSLNDHSYQTSPSKAPRRSRQELVQSTKFCFTCKVMDNASLRLTESTTFIFYKSPNGGKLVYAIWKAWLCSEQKEAPRKKDKGRRVQAAQEFMFTRSRGEEGRGEESCGEARWAEWRNEPNREKQDDYYCDERGGWRKNGYLLRKEESSAWRDHWRDERTLFRALTALACMHHIS
ncbi:hypothetical protein F5880DRAFT_1511172 [Lentinula raphanica]|nr:hypothetical protein F5880DRAFT_1511172 [Lentinula raphanica]